MAFYETKQEISKKIATYLQSLQREQGLIPDEIKKQYIEITSNFKDLYSYSLLKQGALKEDAPTFSNSVNPTHEWDVMDHFEEVFTALGLQTTQACAHAFQRRLERACVENVLSEQQKKNLHELHFFRERSEKLSNWVVRARGIIVTMCSNFPLLQSVTEEEKEFGDSLNFDWYYSYSDQSSTWRAGDAKHREVGKRVKQTLEEKPHLKKVVDAIAAAHNLGSGFFTYTGY